MFPDPILAGRPAPAPLPPLQRAAVARRVALIRAFEESLDPLFRLGQIAGTYHRCIGQEATAVGVTWHLDPGRDFVVSNHRNHGHYLAFTGDLAGLHAELRGLAEGVTGGRGGSQVLATDHFLSNGILGSTLPVAAGIALGLRRRKENACVVCFAGDGALCEGAAYEALNLASLWSLPLLFVVEYNHLVQSAATETVLAGLPAGRFEAVGIPVVQLDSTDVFEILDLAGALVGRVRSGRGPAALVVEAARLCAHSKGDDSRNQEELALARTRDPMLLLERQIPEFAAIRREAEQTVRRLGIGEVP